MKQQLIPRQLYYAAHLYASNVKRGEEYNEFNTVYSILICNETVHPDTSEYLLKYQMRTEDGLHARPELNMIILELIKIPDASTIMAEIEKTGDKMLNSIDPVLKWGLFFKSATDPESKPLIEKLAQDDKGIRMSTTLLDRLTADDYAQARIFERERILMDYKTDMTCARREGLEIGKLEGIEEGLQKGKLEGKLETARAMKAEGFTAAQIAKITGLDETQIESL